jgi:hypothetical protein
MKKLIFITFLLFLFIGCTQTNPAGAEPSFLSKESTAQAMQPSHSFCTVHLHNYTGMPGDGDTAWLATRLDYSSNVGDTNFTDATLTWPSAGSAIYLSEFNGSKIYKSSSTLPLNQVTVLPPVSAREISCQIDSGDVFFIQNLYETWSKVRVNRMRTFLETRVTTTEVILELYVYPEKTPDFSIH